MKSCAWPASHEPSARPHGYIATGRRVPLEPARRRGQAFVIAQTRLGGGRIHHAMRTMATVRKALQMMCERALSRRTQGGALAEKQLVQQAIADSFIQIERFRLLVLYAAWHIDKGHKNEARTYIAAVKVETAEVLHDVVRRALHCTGPRLLERDALIQWATVPSWASRRATEFRSRSQEGLKRIALPVSGPRFLPRRRRGQSSLAEHLETRWEL